MKATKFTYSYKPLKIINDFFDILIIIFSFVFGIAALREFVSDPDTFLLFLFLGFSIWIPFIVLAMSFWHADIELQSNGLLVHFIFKSLFVEWKDIKLVKHAKFFGFGGKSLGSIVVVNKGLTQFHRIYGIVYGVTRNPAFLIVSNINYYEELVSIIKNNIKKPEEKTNKKQKKFKRNLQ